MRNNRTAGNNFERYLVHKLKNIFSDVCTSRSESRTMDSKKVDLCKTEPFYFQAKSLSRLVDYVKVLDSMPSDGINIICHRKTKKKNIKFVTEGEYAIMSLDSLILLLESIKTGKNIINIK